MEQDKLLKRLVETESPSHDKAAVDRVGVIVAEEARKLGAQVDVISNRETGDHVLMHFGESGLVLSHRAGKIEAHKKPILLLCHMDTVFPLGTIDKFPYRELDGKIVGPGTLDMKAGIKVAPRIPEATTKRDATRSRRWRIK
jgi:glutamate carboxypeptidase